MGSGVEREAGGGTEFVDEAFVLGELGGWLTGSEGVSGRAREVLEELKEGTPAEREAVLALAPLVVHVLARGNHGNAARSSGPSKDLHARKYPKIRKR